jgi:protein-S-isoprenylcysteine O-methyltransferase Ste14
VLVLLVGLALAESSWTLLVLAAVAAVAAHLWVVRVEEPRLAARFGPAYAAYLRRVPRWIPAWQPAADEIDPVPPSLDGRGAGHVR